MKITLENKYRSLFPFESDELPDLTIITGKNGSGKSQLLELLEKKFSNDTSVSSIGISISPKIFHVRSEGIIRKQNLVGQIDNRKSKVRSYKDSFRELKINEIEYYKYLLDNNIKYSLPIHDRVGLISEDSDYMNLLNLAFGESYRRHGLTRALPGGVVAAENFLLHSYHSKFKRVFEFVSLLCLHNNKGVFSLTDADFHSSPIDEYLVDEPDLFISELDMIFYNYAVRRDLNSKGRYYKTKQISNNNSLDESDFDLSHPAPWDIINNIFKDNRIDFYFTGILFKEFHPDNHVNFKLIKKSIDTEVDFSDLSSGEKIIIGLVIKLFTSRYYGSKLTYPDLMILDEPDAHLHPEISKLLLDVLENAFVKEYGIKVILTTHSPSTIALAPEDSVYQLTNGDQTSLRKICKDDALKLLTGFIPTLSIDYKNHRQVFVESPTDRFYYQSLFNKHMQGCSMHHELYFISNALGKGNCTQVRDVVNDLRRSGNSTSFGIIDWDLSNAEEDYILVHGINDRYSLENFVLDPIYLMSLLMADKNPVGLSVELGLGEFYDPFSIGKESNDKLQTIVEYVFKKFESIFPSYKYASDKREVKYLNEKSVQIPIWFLEIKGHELEEKLRKVFEPLKKYQGEGKLQDRLTEIIVTCYPFAPLTTIKLLETIGVPKQ